MSPVDPALAAHDPLSAPTAATARARVVIEAQMAMLTRLAQIGMEIAEACGRQAAAQAEAGRDFSRGAAPQAARLTAPHDPGLAFARVARAVRMTIALQSRLLRDLAGLDSDDARAQASLKDGRRMRLSRLVDQAAEAAITARRDAAQTTRAGWTGDSLEDEIEHLASEAYERLTDAEDDAELGDRPFAEVVASICGDLGLSPDWTARLLAAVQPAPPPASDGPTGGAPLLRPPLSPANPPNSEPGPEPGPQAGPDPDLDLKQRPERPWPVRAPPRPAAPPPAPP